MLDKPSFETYALSNGLTVALQLTRSENIFGNLRINHGALHELPGEEGIAHFLEHMFIEGGTSKYTPEEQAVARGNFGYTNAITSRSKTRIPWGMVSQDLETYLDMASQMAFYPRLDEKVIEQQKKVVLSEISRTKGAPEFEDIFKFYLPSMARDRDHTYFVLGNEDVIRNLTQEQLRNFHTRGYHPNNMILMLAGNLPRNTLSMVENYFGSIPSGSGKPIEFSSVSPLSEQKVVKHSFAPDLLNKDNPEESNSRIRLGVVVPDEFHKDSSALAIASEILGSSWTTGLKKRIRSEEGMSYDIGSYYSGDENFGSFFVAGKIHAKRQERAIEIIFEEMKRLGSVSQSNEEVEGAKRRVMYEIANTIGSTFDDFVSVDPINIAEIGKMDYKFDGRAPIKEKLDQLARVTPEDVQRVSNLYLPSDKEMGKYVLLIRDPLRS
ncbi:insulinase family protein [Candidatus Pacearchaeota archaeon]|nr:insulinase family protein [Candidatus Pacearchaeota archaeon]